MIGADDLPGINIGETSSEGGTDRNPLALQAIPPQSSPSLPRRRPSLQKLGVSFRQDISSFLQDRPDRVSNSHGPFNGHAVFRRPAPLLKLGRP